MTTLSNALFETHRRRSPSPVGNATSCSVLPKVVFSFWRFKCA